MSIYRIPESANNHESCLECGSHFYGRANKKFCSEGCKNRYHNRRYQGIRNTKCRILNILEKNYDLLSHLIQDNRLSVEIVELLVLGYNPDYITSFRKAGKYSMCSCYDIIFFRSDTRIYNIRKAERFQEI